MITTNKLVLFTVRTLVYTLHYYVSIVRVLLIIIIYVFTLLIHHYKFISTFYLLYPKLVIPFQNIHITQSMYCVKENDLTFFFQEKKFILLTFQDPFHSIGRKDALYRLINGSQP